MTSMRGWGAHSSAGNASTRWPYLWLAALITCHMAARPTAQTPAPPETRNATAEARDDGRAQYPALLANSYVSLNTGFIHYPFSSRQLEPGFSVELVTVPHVAVQAVLFGHHFGKYVSAQGTYMRPVKYVVYSNINQPGNSHTVWMHFGTATMQARVPVSGRVSIYGETGLAITNRSGFEIDDVPVVKNVHFASALYGGGVEYRANRTWDLVLGGAYVPASTKHRQPHTVFASLGGRYNMRPLPPDKVQETIAAGALFPKHLLQVGYATNAFGYGANNVLSKKIPIFWGGRVEVAHSIATVHYQRNLFHTKRVLAIDLGGSVSRWQSSQRQERFTTLSVFPLMRFTVLRTRPADLYGFYSVAGPTYISTDVIDGRDTGGRFTFQDFMGVGVFMGKGRRLNAEINLNHYSNGNILQENAGVKIPLTFKLGVTF
jgi:hypothetical protein